MAEGVVTPTVPAKNDILLGEGVIRYNYTSGGGTVLGATRGGSSLKIERTIKEIAYDGAFGPTKGLRRKTIVVPRLIVKNLKLNYTTIPLMFGSSFTVSDEGDYHKIIEDMDMADADYLTDITFVGQKLDGKACIIIVYNALGDGNIEFAFSEKDEVVPETTFTGHYATGTPTTIPYELRDYDV